MKKIIRLAGIFSLFFLMSQNGIAQDHTKMYFGPGMGLDYGGFGAKFEYLPVEKVGLFGGVGYNLLNVGWNVGVTYKIFLSDRVSINPMAFYGYNGVSVVKGASYYNKTSLGPTVGVNVDIKMRESNHKLSLGFFVPFRSQEFKDNYDAMRNDYRVFLDGKLLPVAVGIGFNFAL